MGDVINLRRAPADTLLKIDGEKYVLVGRGKRGYINVKNVITGKVVSFKELVLTEVLEPVNGGPTVNFSDTLQNDGSRSFPKLPPLPDDGSKIEREVGSGLPIKDIDDNNLNYIGDFLDLVLESDEDEEEESNGN